MKAQKDRARAAGKFSVDQSETNAWKAVQQGSVADHRSEFVGYDDAEVETKIIGYRKEGDRFALQLTRTPFYAESGGQVADTGVLKNDEDYLKVIDVQKGADGKNIHYVDNLPEDLSGTWTASIDLDKRIEIQKHHSATHLVHAALRGILGDHVAQKGSLVDENHLRFDFSHFEAMTDDQLEEVEQLVNEKVQENIPLQEERNVPIDEAKERGAMMLFGEKYGETVRVITFDEDYSVELCGGTHVGATGEIGYFRFTNETSVAAGIRRIEAVCGTQADKILRDEKRLLQQVKGAIGQTEDLAADVMKLIEDKKALEKELEKVQMQNTGAKLDELIRDAVSLDSGIKLVKGEIAGADMDALKQLGYDGLQKTKENTAIVLGSKDEEQGKVYLMVALTEDIISEKELKAGALVGQLGRIVGGGGGGQPNLATAGGREPEKLSEALEKVNELIEESIS